MAFGEERVIGEVRVDTYSFVCFVANVKRHISELKDVAFNQLPVSAMIPWFDTIREVRSDVDFLALFLDFDDINVYNICLFV